MTRFTYILHKVGANCPALSLVVLASGCAALRMPKPQESVDIRTTTLAAWASGEGENAGTVEGGWLEAFGDERLNGLVAEALRSNQNLLIASARLKIAREGTIIGRAARLPSVTGSGSGSYGETRFEDGTGSLGPAIESESLSLSLDLSWEIDLWGRLADLHRATQADYEAQRADYRGARLSLAANTAKAWYGLVTAKQLETLATQTRDSFARNLRITERLYKEAGPVAARALDVQLARTQVASAERSLIARQLERDDAKRSLELLLGRYPAAAITGSERLTDPPGTVPAGLPSELLMRRPDLVAAAADLRASANRADAARKDLLPNISLSVGGSAGGASLDLIDLIGNPASIAWSVAASLVQPIYRGERLEAQARQALATNEVAIQSFVSIALRAFREVESALAAEHSLAAQHAFLETELTQANLAETSATRDYSEGLVGILSVLEAQRRAFNARSAMISLRNGRIQNRIDLYLALGGDFQTSPDTDAPIVASRDRVAREKTSSITHE